MNQLFTKLLFLLSFGVVSFTAHAQDTSRVDRYCEVTLTPAGFASGKASMKIDSAQASNPRKDSRLKDANGKIKEFASFVEALNYVGGLGWKLVSFSIDNKFDIYYCIFKKEVLKSALEQ